MERRVTVKTPRATLTGVPAGTHVAVKAVNARGLESWDWAKNDREVTLPADLKVGGSIPVPRSWIGGADLQVGAI